MYIIQIITVDEEFYVIEKITRDHCAWLYVPFDMKMAAFAVSDNINDSLLTTLNNAIDTNMEQIMAVQVTQL